MASAENQGKTIALVIFAVLFVVSSVVAYIFFDKVDQLEQQANEARTKQAASDRAANESKTAYEDLRGKVAGKEGDTHETIMGLVKADLESAASKLNEQRRQAKPIYDNYTSALTYLHTELTQSDARVKTLEETNAKLEEELKSVKSKYDTEVATARQATDTKTQELLAREKELVDINSEQEGRITDLTRRYGQLRDQNEQYRNDIEGMKKTHGRAIADTQRIIEQYRDKEILSNQIKFSGSDGEVVQLEQDGKQAYVNIGSDDGVQSGLTFGVYGKDVGGNPYEMPKASLEIVRILGPHRSLGRVTGEKPENAVLPGDLLYNPIWNMGNRESIAFVGLMYLDDDKNEDSEKFKQLVESLGAKVDAFADIKNEKTVGKITVDTGWLVVGDIPEDADKEELDPKMARVIAFLRGAKRDLFQQARDNGVRLINVRNFMTYMGHNKPDNRVGSGAEYRYFYGKKRPPLVDKGPQGYDDDKKGKK
ncbi:MAG: hypothetical protein U1D30_08615 [Planctomycetota bacterium]